MTLKLFISKNLLYSQASCHHWVCTGWICSKIRSNWFGKWNHMWSSWWFPNWYNGRNWSTFGIPVSTDLWRLCLYQGNYWSMQSSGPIRYFNVSLAQIIISIYYFEAQRVNKSIISLSLSQSHCHYYHGITVVKGITLP